MGEDGRRLPIVGRVGEFPRPGEYQRFDFLTRPHWTLDRLLSEPPEGWRFERCPCGNAGHPGWLHWGEIVRRPFGTQSALHEVTLEVFVGESGVTTKPFVAASRTQARLAEAFQAAAELALILAEVVP